MAYISEANNAPGHVTTPVLQSIVFYTHHLDKDKHMVCSTTNEPIFPNSHDFVCYIATSVISFVVNCLLLSYIGIYEFLHEHAESPLHT